VKVAGAERRQELSSEVTLTVYVPATVGAPRR
jgi:hypothetical protein